MDKNFYGKIVECGDQEWEIEIFNGKKRKFIKGGTPYRERLDSRPNQRYYIETPDG